jgi:hypothetical protein
MNIIKVTDKKSRKKFLDTARIIYKNDKTWVCPLDKDIESIFDPASIPISNMGRFDRWVLEDDNGKLIGRVAAFIDHNLAQPTTSLPAEWVF